MWTKVSWLALVQAGRNPMAEGSDVLGSDTAGEFELQFRHHHYTAPVGGNCLAIDAKATCQSLCLPHIGKEWKDCGKRRSRGVER